MGQTIEINGSRLIGDVLVINTNRSLAGQDGESFSRGSAEHFETFPALLARRLFEADGSLTRVHVMSNAVSLSRQGNWDAATESAMQAVVTAFFRYYPDEPH